MFHVTMQELQCNGVIWFIENAGFMKDNKNASPRIIVNPNYTQINVQQELNDKDSILNFYKELIKMRKDYVDVAVNGVFKDFFKDDENACIYTRTYQSKVMFVANNFTKYDQKLNVLIIQMMKLILARKQLFDHLKHLY